MIKSEGKVVLKKTGAWKWRMRSRAERSLTSRGKDCRDRCVAGSLFKAASENLQQQLQEVGQRRNYLLLVHQRVQMRSRKIQSIQDKKKKMQKETAAALAKNEMAEAEMEAELQGLQAGEEKKGSNASQAVECCWETMVEQNFALGVDQARRSFVAMCQIFFKRLGTPPAQMRGKEEGRKESKSKGTPVVRWFYQRQGGTMESC